MRRIPECERCLFYSKSPYLVCTLFPEVIEGKRCPDFREDPNAEDDELWAPEGYLFQGDELVRINYDEGQD